jgi:hypothetical protein
MSIKYTIGENGVEIRTTGKNGAETIRIEAYDKAIDQKDIVAAMRKNTKQATSMRAASLSFISAIQESGVLKPWYGSGTVASELLKKMREAEETQAKEWGMSPEDIAEMRKPGAYADSRSHALKAWGFGIALKHGVDDKGVGKLLTVSTLRQINASKRAKPEPTGINGILDKLADHLANNPQDVIVAEKAMLNTIKYARSLLDKSALLLAGQTVEPKDESTLTRKQVAAAKYQDQPAAIAA